METPISLGERRALEEDDCNHWSPRELLIHLIREIDKGEIAPDGMVVSFFTREGKFTRTGMRRSRTTVMEAVAIIEIAKFDLLQPE